MSKIRSLITTTSFQDTPGRHHDLLVVDAYDVERVRGPLPESTILALVGDYDTILCGDDAFTRLVLQKCLPRLKVLSKYGIGVDKVDLQAATELHVGGTLSGSPRIADILAAARTLSDAAWPPSELGEYLPAPDSGRGALHRALTTADAAARPVPPAGEPR